MTATRVDDTPTYQTSNLQARNRTYLATGPFFSSGNSTGEWWCLSLFLGRKKGAVQVTDVATGATVRSPTLSWHRERVFRLVVLKRVVAANVCIRAAFIEQHIRSCHPLAKGGASGDRAVLLKRNTKRVHRGTSSRSCSVAVKAYELLFNNSTLLNLMVSNLQV